MTRLAIALRFTMLIFAVGTLLCFVRCASAQSPETFSLKSIQRIDVPDDRLKDWPDRDNVWIPMDRGDFERRLGRLLAVQRKDVTPDWKQAYYSAILTDDNLVFGRLRAEVSLRQRRSQLINLGDPSLAIEELTWNHIPALWGASLDRRHLIVQPQDQDVLEGRWTARGRPLQSGIAFDLQLMPASVSVVELFVPADQVVTSDAGDVVRQNAAASDRLRAWSIYLGAQTHCRLVISPAPAARDVPPTALYEQDLSVVVNTDELLLRQTCQIEVLDGSLDRLTVSMPRAVEITSVTYGEQTPLKFERIPIEGPAVHLAVFLPEAIHGRSRPIRLEGTMRRGAGDSVAAPQFSIENAVWVDGRVNFSVVRPWELRSFRATGYRQVSPGAQRSEGETIVFQQVIPRAQLLLNVDRPVTERVAHVLNLLTRDENVWNLTTEIAWGSRSGTVFDASCRIPDGWRVVSVVQLGGGRESRELSTWELRPHPVAGQVLSLEFPEGVAPGRIEAIRIEAERSVGRQGAAARFPIITPVDCETSEVLLSWDGDTTGDVWSVPRESFETFDVAAAAPVWNTLPSWSVAIDEDVEHRRLDHVLNLDSLWAPVAVAKLPQLQAAADIQITLQPQTIREQFEIRVRSVGSNPMLELILPNQRPEIVWSLRNSDASLAVSRQPIPPELASTNSHSRSEMYQISIEGRQSTEWILLGEREIPFVRNYALPLAVVTGLPGFQGQISVQPDLPAGLLLKEIAPQNLSAGIAASQTDRLTPGELKRWTYRPGDQAWISTSAQPHQAVPAAAVYRLSSTLTEELQGYDEHELTLSPVASGGFESFRFELAAPAKMIAVEQDHRLMSVVADGSVFKVSGCDDITGHPVVVRYRTPAARTFSRGTHQLQIPSLPWDCMRFTWDVAMPGTLAFHTPPAALSWTSPPITSPWWSRLCGPLGKSSAMNWFALTAENDQPTLRQSSASASAQDAQVPFSAGWNVYQATSATLPDAQQYVVWEQASLQLMNWTLMWGCLPLGVMIRRRSSRVHRRVIAILLGTAGCGAIFGPEGWNAACGSLFSGLILAILLPIEIWRVKPPVSLKTGDGSVSTEIFRRTALPLACWIFLAWLIPGSAAQEQTGEPATNSRAKQSKDPPLRVLVPVDRAGKPSVTLPVVYVSPTLSDLLNPANTDDSAEPQQLIEAADYLLSSDQNQRLSLKVKYVVAVRQDAQSVELQIPLDSSWKNGLEACYVDGQLQPATFTPDQQFLGLTTDAPPADAATDKQPPLFRRHEILLDIRLPVAESDTPVRFRGALFPVLNSHLAWQKADSLPPMEIPGSQGAVTSSLDRRLIEARLGAVSGISVRRARPDTGAASREAVQVLALQLLTVHPTFTHVAFRIDCRVTEGPVNRFEMRLPAGALLREIRGHQVLQTAVRPAPDAGTEVVMEFTEPQSRDFALEGEYILVQNSAEPTVEVPRLHFPGKIADPAVRNLVAVASGPEFAVQVVNPEDPAMLPIPVEQFVSHWGDTVPNQQPQFCLQVQDSGQPALRLSPVASEQELISWREDVAISHRQLDWALSAEVKTSRLPAFAFAVLLDRRLTIESVSLRENGVESLLRWSKTPMIGSSQNRVTIFLNREIIGVCQLKIQGNMKVRPSTPIALPSMRFETPQSITGTLTLFHEVGHRLTLEGRQTAIESSVRVIDPIANGLQMKYFQRLKIQEGDSGLTARLDSVAGACRSTALWLVETSEETWRLRGAMELAPQPGTREIRIEIPAWMAAARISTPHDAPQPTETTVDGQRLLQIPLGPDVTDPVLVNWEVEFSPPESSADNLLLPVVQHSAENQVWAASRSDRGWRILDQAAAAVSDAPAAIREQLTQWDAVDVLSLTRIVQGAIPLQRFDEQSPDGRTSVALIEHAIRRSAGGGWRGRTEVYPTPTAGIIELQAPTGMRIVRVLADQQIVPLDTIDLAGQRCRLDSAAGTRRFAVDWIVPSDSTAPDFTDRISIPLLRCLQERQPKTLVTLWVGDLPEIVLPRHLAHRTTWDLTCNRLEIDLERYRHRQNSDPPDADLARWIWREYRAAAVLLTRSGNVSRLSDADRRRWDRMTQEVNQIGEPAAPSDQNSDENEFSLAPLDENDVVTGQLSPDAATLECRLIRKDAVNWIAGGVLLMLCIWLLPAVLGLLLSDWWQVRPHLAWMTLGVLWWFCWSPAIVGWALIAWSVWRMLWQPRFGVPKVVAG